MPSFKVPCPSCEAQVLIKNPNLIGTKVECPKCKYRFKVEEPAAEGGGEDKAKKKEEKAAKPKKKNKSKMTGILVAVGVVVLLGGVGYAVLGGKKKDPAPPRNNTSVGNTNPTPDEGDQKKDEKPPEKAKPKYTLPLSDKDPTNLLHGQAVAVYRVNMEQATQSPLFNGLFDANSDLFKSSMGFEIGNVETYYHCVVGADRSAFGVMRLVAPTAAKDLTAKMSLEPGPKMVKDRALHTIKSNPFLTAVGQTLAARSVLGDVYETMPGKAATPPKTSGVCFYDTQTILLGDLATVEQFLTGLKADGYPVFKSVLAGGEGKDVGKAELTTNPTYRTIEVALKRNLNAVDADAQNPPMIAFAELLTPGEYDPKMFKKEYKPIGDVLDPVLR
ncbi:MAG TPA: IBR domain-containing protein, partial [Gemmataceae bacterium]|nr:IBR domain-containing protein [Gemmataceae bacterium]